MGPLIVIAIAAGAASAFLAAGVAAGSIMAVPLFYLAPLPVMIAGMAFSPWAALGAALAATAGLGLSFGGSFLLAYLLGMGLPAFALSYAALLAREEKAARDGLLWFPVGTLILMAAGFAFTQDPKDESWLWREARLRDPDGVERIGLQIDNGGLADGHGVDDVEREGRAAFGRFEAHVVGRTVDQKREAEADIEVAATCHVG